ncbi:MAG: PP2C family protein-serine/threonine phosphatase [Panacagrimonas sp.]
MLTKSHGRSDRGLVRSHNEDAFLDDALNRLWVVADGMGGHAAGDVASQTVIRHLQQVAGSAPTADYVDRIDDALAAANAELVVYAREHGVGVVGTTAVVLLDAGPYMLCAWVGDSRLYRLSGGSIEQVTTDHVQTSAARASSSGAHKSAHSGALLRAVGAEAELIVEWRVIEVAAGDVLLVCSDGVTKELSDREIATFLAQASPLQELVDALVNTCLARGGHDNITAIVVRVEA